MDSEYLQVVLIRSNAHISSRVYCCNYVYLCAYNDFYDTDLVRCDTTCAKHIALLLTHFTDMVLNFLPIQNNHTKTMMKINKCR